MKKFVAIAATAAFLAGVSMSALAAEKSTEDKCKEMAAKEKVAADKMDAYVKECVKKHSMGEKGSMAPSTSAPAK